MASAQEIIRSNEYRLVHGPMDGETVNIDTLAYPEPEQVNRLQRISDWHESIKRDAWEAGFGVDIVEDAVIFDNDGNSISFRDTARKLHTKHAAGKGVIDIARMGEDGDVGLAKYRAIFSRNSKIRKKLFGIQPKEKDIEAIYFSDLDVRGKFMNMSLGTLLMYNALVDQDPGLEVKIDAVGEQGSHANEWYRGLGFRENPSVVLPELKFSNDAPEGLILPQTRYDQIRIGHLVNTLESRLSGRVIKLS